MADVGDREEMATVDAALLARIGCDLESRIAMADRERLATSQTYFDHVGSPPVDADAHLLEDHAARFSEAAVRNDIDLVADKIKEYVMKFNINLRDGGIDEKIIGRHILEIYASSCRASAKNFRENILPYLMDNSERDNFEHISEFDNEREILEKEINASIKRSMIVAYFYDNFPDGVPGDQISKLVIAKMIEAFRNSAVKMTSVDWKTVSTAYDLARRKRALET